MSKTEAEKVEVRKESNPAEMTEPAPGDNGASVVVEYPRWGPVLPPEDEQISFHQLQLAQFHGADPEPLSHSHLERFEEFLRSHAVGGSARKSEGHYGEKTVDLVRAANEKFLGVDSSELTPQLWQVLKAAGAPVVD